MMQANAEVKNRPLDPVAFHLTGRANGVPDALDGMRPALFAPYRDLTALRYDFPVVLAQDDADGAGVHALSVLIDRLLQKVAPPGPDSEQLRKMILRLEAEIRALVAQGARGSLSELWDQASDRLAALTGGAVGESVRIARAALEVDGDCIDCDAEIAGRFVSHVWDVVQAEKAQRFRSTASRLAVKLEDILRAEFTRSAAGRSAASLKAALGGAHQNLFDFEAMSQLLPQSSAAESLPESRRRRIEWALWTIKRQRFFAGAAGQGRPGHATDPYSFSFETCSDALTAFRERLQEMVDLIKALSIAELETDGRYVDSKHDAFFEKFDASSLSAQDMALFPDYLVVISKRPSAADHAGILDALSSGLPLKVVVNIDDLVEEGPAGDGHFTFGMRSAQLASLATGLGEAFVLQSASANLYQMRERVFAGLSFQGPALFSVFTGIPGNPALSRYLTSAAAMQSRAFPAFTYDPAAGSDLASRFSLAGNPAVEADWTTQAFDYADDNLQRVREQIAFTFVDFLAADPRYARHFIRVPRTQWSDRMVSVADWLERASAPANAVPFVWISDADDKLARLVVDDKAITAARRCLDVWHRLQEFGGVRNSHADRLLAREKAAWDEQRKREDAVKAETAPVAAAAPTVGAAASPAVSAPASAAATASEPARSPDEAYIETARCSSCNECIQVNDKMFVYNDNKQAYIANADAGSFRQLVEAAENCPLAIIHPGKPRNTSEADLDDLQKRAQSFA